MSLYRQAGRTRATVVAGVAVAALLVGGGIGFALGRSSAPEPTASDVIARVRDELKPVANGLELLPTEYPQAYQGAGNESAAVKGDLAKIRKGYASARADLVALDPRGATRLGNEIAQLEHAIGAHAPPADIREHVRTANEALAQVPGGG